MKPSLLFALLLPLAAPALAAEPLRLTPMPPAETGLEAFPRLAEAEDAPSQKINQALAAADERGRAAAASCRKDLRESGADPHGAGWTRTVRVAMRGPAFLSVTAADEIYCGGPHPDAAVFALAYDLRTGSPLNWERLMPKALSGKASLTSAADGTRLGVLTSPKLRALYLKASKPDAECAQALEGDELPLMLWPDAQAGGVAIQPADLPHVIAACGPAAIIPVAVLRPMGVDGGLLDAIEAAHKAGNFGKPR